MKAILARPRGFCAEDVCAVESVERMLARHAVPICLRQEIASNDDVAESLETRSAFGRANIDAISESQNMRHTAKGRAGRCEAEGTMGRIPMHLIRSAADVAQLDLPAARPFVTRTALSVDDTKNVIAALKHRFPDRVEPQTEDVGCATRNQRAAVEAILVVAANNSSNSNRLREIGGWSSVPSYLVADQDDLELDREYGAFRSFRPFEPATLPWVEENIEFRLSSELIEA